MLNDALLSRLALSLRRLGLLRSGYFSGAANVRPRRPRLNLAEPLARPGY
jgi:hypothetical protein